MSTNIIVPQTSPYFLNQATDPKYSQLVPGHASGLAAHTRGATAVGMPNQLTPVAGTGQPTLSHYLTIGRTYHPLCRHAFVEKRVIGYYQYERRVAFRTCAMAAAYAGAFGPTSIERPEFSYSMAIWRLSQHVGYDMEDLCVYGPTGRYQSVAKEMIALVDNDFWTREGVAEWLASLGL